MGRKFGQPDKAEMNICMARSFAGLFFGSFSRLVQWDSVRSAVAFCLVHLLSVRSTVAPRVGASRGGSFNNSPLPGAFWCSSFSSYRLRGGAGEGIAGREARNGPAAGPSKTEKPP